MLGPLVAILIAGAAGDGGTAHPRSVEASPTSVAIVSKSICLAMLTAARGNAFGSECIFGPNYWSTQLSEIVPVLGDGDGNPEPQDIAQLDLDANHIHEDDGFSFVFAFVQNDTPVTFRVDGGGGAVVSSGGFMPGSEWTCVADDEDCDGDGQRGDGVIVTGICPSLGDAICSSAPRFTTPNATPGGHTLEVIQDGTVQSTSYQVVAEPASVSVSALEDTIASGIVDLNGDGSPSGEGECPVPRPLTASRIFAYNDTPQRTLVLARITGGGADVASGWVRWTTSDIEHGVLALEYTPSFELEGFGIVAPNILCGTAQQGPVTVTAALTRTVVLNFSIDPFAGSGSDSTTVTIGPPPAPGVPTDPPPPAPTEPAPPDTPVPQLPTATETPAPQDTAVPPPGETPPPAAETPIAPPAATVPSLDGATPPEATTFADATATARAPAATATARAVRACPDVDGDGAITLRDVIAVARSLGRRAYDPQADVTLDGRVTARDLLTVLRRLRRPCG